MKRARKDGIDWEAVVEEHRATKGADVLDQAGIAKELKKFRQCIWVTNFSVPIFAYDLHTLQCHLPHATGCAQGGQAHGRGGRW